MVNTFLLEYPQIKNQYWLTFTFTYQFWVSILLHPKNIETVNKNEIHNIGLLWL